MVDEIINAFYDSEHHYGYDYVYTVDNTPQNDDEFKLHNHNDRYEIILFLTGNAEFHIEGNIYRSHPMTFISPARWIFKKVTRYTVNHYINYKRLLMARELYSRGQTLLEASTNAGFNNYAHFYRMYRREFGTSPRS